ncbi:helix-turn-helix domain-containing protein [Streptomyces sp. NPDC058471]|uniref:helix-turn-helix domain-containing protein n=1 Tax=Streptomyces sp. NPDC058471 TaxID=3346516 RepID=UPI00365F71AA
MRRRLEDTTEEEWQEELKKRRRRDKLYNMGRPQRVTPPEFEQLTKLILRAKGNGMSATQIARQVGGGIHQTTVSNIARGAQKSVNRDNYDKLMTLRVEASETALRTGARVSPIPTQRRIQALNAIGFHCALLGEHLNMSKQAVQHMGYAETAFVFGSTARAIAELYSKLADTNPADYGIDDSTLKRIITLSARKGCAPPSCWDDDTIDDPAALPEWTGACGTPEGYRVHIRETLAGTRLPLCAACKQVVETGDRTRETGFKFRADRFAEVLTEKGFNPRSLARSMGRTDAYADKLYRWRDSSREPQSAGDVRILAAALDVDDSELMEEVVGESGTAQAAIGRGGFNPYVMRATVELAELSHTQIAKILGVSHTSAGNWIRGMSAPKSPAVIKPLADHLGVQVDVFYS